MYMEKPLTTHQGRCMRRINLTLNNNVFDSVFHPLLLTAAALGLYTLFQKSTPNQLPRAKPFTTTTPALEPSIHTQPPQPYQGLMINRARFFNNDILHQQQRYAMLNAEEQTPEMSV
jgi:hypothetical protein